MLWTTWFTLPLAAAVQETAGRLGLVTGRGLASLMKVVALVLMTALPLIYLSVR